MTNQNGGKEKLRTQLRKMNVGEEIIFAYEPKKMSLSSIRVTASTLGVDMGRKYAVRKEENIIRISRESVKKSCPTIAMEDGFQRKEVRP